jgi:hypothetical protein
MKSVIRLSLTTEGSLRKAVRELEEYKASLQGKIERLIERLLDVGCETGIANSGDYAGMIVFSKEIIAGSDNVEGLLIATDGTKIIREWKYRGGLRHATVSPLLMAEFGSGWLSKVLDNVEGVGQGTFPDQEHAFDPQGWWWETPDGEKHHSYGEAPTYPVHSAMFAMMFEVDRIAKEVFNGK